MKKLTITNEGTYKSFDANFHTVIEGDLVIISGLNGSGKTQLVDIIKGYKHQDQNQRIPRILQLDEVSISIEEIAHKSFRDYYNISNITPSNVSSALDVKNTVWGWYQNNQLSYDTGLLNGFRTVSRDIKDILIERFGQESFINNTIPEKEFKETIPKDFVLYQDDIFTNKIGEIFFNYASDVYHNHAVAHRDGTTFNESDLPTAPWVMLNNLFKELKFNYRFKDNYERVGDVINEQPAIYGLYPNDEIDEQQKRNLEDLSDGEKAIISLVFAMIASEQTHPKILLLDEYDATLNPSLIEAFFKVLKTFFIDKGAQVILVTHSSATISLAPEYAQFYEVFKKDTGTERILPVSREGYRELSKVYKEFYEKNQDQVARMAEINGQNSLLVAENALLKASIDNLRKPLIITEGKTDTQHLKKALEALGIIDIDLDFFDQSGLADSLGSSKLKAKLIELASVPHAQKIIGIFDCDEPSYIAEIGLLKDFGNNVYAMCIPVPSSRSRYRSISIEFYYSDEELKKPYDGKQLLFTNEVEEVSSMTDRSLKEIRVCEAKPNEEYNKKIYDHNISALPTAHSKSVFAGLVENSPEFSEGFDFRNFLLIFNQIRVILSI